MQHERVTSYLKEGSLVPVFLQELLLAFGLLVTSALGIFHILFESLFLGECASSFDLLPLDFPSNFSLLVTFNTCQFPYPPRLEFGFGLKTVGIINIGNFSFLLLCGRVWPFE